MKRIFTLSILICALSLCAFAQTSDGLDRATTSSIKAARDKDGNPLITTINRRFTLVDVPTQPLPGALLLLEEFRREHQLGAEGGKGFVKVDAWFGENVSKKAWTIEQDGDDGRVFDEFIWLRNTDVARQSPLTFSLTSKRDSVSFRQPVNCLR